MLHSSAGSVLCRRKIWCAPVLVQVRQIVEDGPGNTPEAYEQYLQCVDRVQESVAVLEKLLKRDRGILEGALGTLEAQFRHLLKSSRYCLHSNTPRIPCS